MLMHISNEVEVVYGGIEDWDLAEPFIKIALGRSCNYGKLPDIKNLIRLKKYRLFLIYNNDIVIGAAITTTESGDYNERWYNILYLFIPNRYDLRDEVVSRLEEDANDIGCTHIHFLSALKIGSRLAKRYGYNERFIEYTKKL